MESKEQACANSMSILLLILQLCNANKKKNKKQSNDLSMIMLHKQTFCYMKKFARKSHMHGGKKLRFKAEKLQQLAQPAKGSKCL